MSQAISAGEYFSLLEDLKTKGMDARAAAYAADHLLLNIGRKLSEKFQIARYEFRELSNGFWLHRAISQDDDFLWETGHGLWIGDEAPVETGRMFDYPVNFGESGIVLATPASEHPLQGPADQIIGQIEELFPNWRAYRDLVDCITCEHHELRKRAEGQL